MSSAITPRRLQKRVDEWRESRMKKWAARLQIHADKSRTVSASVLGISEDKPVHLPTPPSAKSTEFRGRPSTGGQLKKSFSYGDVHDYPGQQRHANQHYQHDYRAGGVNRPEPRSPYQSYHHPPPRSPHHYNPHDYRGSNAPRSEPRKSFSSSGGGYRTSYAPSGGYKGQHQHPSTSNYNYNNKGIRKHTGQSHGQNSVSSPASHASSSHVKRADLRKSLAPKERTVTFEDEKKEIETTKEVLKPEPEPVNYVESIPTPEVESKMNSTFTLDDGQETTSDVCNSDNSAPTVQPDINSLQNVSDENVHSSGTENVSEMNSPQCDIHPVIGEENATENQHEDKPSSSEHVASGNTEIPKIIISSPLPQEGGNIQEEDIDRSCEPQVVVENTTYLPEVEVCEVVEVEVSGNCEVEGAEPVVEETEVDEPSFSLCLDADTVLEEVVDVTTDEVMTEIKEEDKEDADASEVYYPADEASAPSILEVQPAVAVESVEDDEGDCSEEAPSHGEQLSEVVESCDVSSESKVHPAVPEEVEKENNEQSFHDENCVPVQDTSMNDVEQEQQKRLGPSTPEPPKTPHAQKEFGHENPKKHVEEITENLDSLYITPGRSARKSRALVDSTNIVESCSIKYVVRDKKHKEALDVELTPVRRSTRKKAETPGTTKNLQELQELSPEMIRKAKIVPNPFLKF